MIDTKTRNVDSVLVTLLCAAGPVWAVPVAININEPVYAFYPTAMVAQSIALMDMLEGIGTNDDKVSESAAFVDQGVRSIVDDTVHLQGLPIVEIAVGEVVSISDLTDPRPSVVIDVSELVVVSDFNSVDALPIVHINVSEDVSLTDDPGLLPSAYISVDESVAVADIPGVVAYPVVHIDINEEVGVRDDISAVLARDEVVFMDGFEDY